MIFGKEPIFLIMTYLIKRIKRGTGKVYALSLYKFVEIKYHGILKIGVICEGYGRMIVKRLADEITAKERLVWLIKGGGGQCR